MKRMLIFVSFFVLAGATTGGAQTKTGDKEWTAIVESAKKEGKVIVVGSPDPVMRNEVIPKFTARFGIPIEFITGRSSQIVARVKTERASGIYSIDVYLAGPDTTANELYNDKMIDPLRPLLVHARGGGRFEMEDRQGMVCRPARAIRRARIQQRGDFYVHQYRAREARGDAPDQRSAQPQVARQDLH